MRHLMDTLTFPHRGCLTINLQLTVTNLQASSSCRDSLLNGTVTGTNVTINGYTALKPTATTSGALVARLGCSASDQHRNGPTVFYRWTVPATGWYAFDTCDSEFDTQLMVLNASSSPSPSGSNTTTTTTATTATTTCDMLGCSYDYAPCGLMSRLVSHFEQDSKLLVGMSGYTEGLGSYVPCRFSPRKAQALIPSRRLPHRHLLRVLSPGCAVLLSTASFVVLGNRRCPAPRS
eukprot:m.9085 g.9085  ORF g.9085 m.9085 type:complete len:234 (-) comp3403_c0_seq1:693-1394(-)